MSNCNDSNWSIYAEQCTSYKYLFFNRLNQAIFHFSHQLTIVNCDTIKVFSKAALVWFLSNIKSSMLLLHTCILLPSNGIVYF